MYEFNIKRKRRKLEVVLELCLFSALVPINVYEPKSNEQKLNSAKVHSKVQVEKNAQTQIGKEISTVLDEVIIYAEPKIEEETKPEINQEEVELLAHLIEGEAGNQEDECQRAVGNVVMNRIESDKFPDSIKEVIYQKGQYACTWDGNFEKTPSERAYANARWLLEGNRILPDNVVFQSQFEQGSGVYAKIGTEIFCYE